MTTRLERKGSPLVRRRMEKALNAIGSKRVINIKLVKALGGPEAIEELHRRWEINPESVADVLRVASEAVYE